MTERRAAHVVVALALAVAAGACSHPEQSVVDQYFTALNANDTQTLSNFAVVSLDTKGKRVDSWTIKGSTNEENVPAPLEALAKAAKDAEAKVADNKKEAQRYNNDHFTEIDQVKELLRKNAKIPANLKPHADKWEEFNKNDREGKKAAAIAKDALEKEKRLVALSVGTTEGLESMTGKMITKTLDVSATIAGEAKDYALVLRKYELTGGSGRTLSRWVIYEVKPKA